MRGRRRVVATTIGFTVVLSTVAVAAGPPGASSRRAQGPARAAVTDPTRSSVPQTGAAAPVSRALRVRRGELRDSLGRQAMLTPDEHGGVKAVGRLDGFLTGRSSADAKTIALDWVRAHAAALDLDAAGIAALQLVRDYTSDDGVRHLQWAQVVDGITVVDTTLVANVARDGRLVNVLGGARGGLKLPSARPSVTASSAYRTTLRSVGSNRTVPRQRSARTTGTRRTTFAGNGEAQLVAYTAGSGLRLAWRVVAPVSRDGDYDGLIDAQSGRLVRRTNLVKFADALVMDNVPGAPQGGAQTQKPITQWLTPGQDRLIGPNTHAFLDVNDVVGPTLDETTFEDHFDVPPAGEVPSSDGTNWLYPIQSFDFPEGLCPAAEPNCTWDYTDPNSWQVNQEQATTQLFYYVNKFHDHLEAGPIGFDNASGNFEGDDAILAQADDGANTAAGLPDGDHQDNANFDTRQDGTPGLMQMYLWQPVFNEDGDLTAPFATVNGTDDPSIVYHEYTHGLSNRLITDSTGFGALGGPQSGAMGEAWSDWYALDFLAQEGLISDDPGAVDVKEGAYVDNGFNLIRSEAVDCPPEDDRGSDDCAGFFETGPGGYTYQDFGLIAFGAPGGTRVPEVHADGEIWTQTLWQLRQGLVAKYGQANGSRRAEALVTGGMRLGPPSPSFLDQRNAILQADTVLGGADRELIWRVFASRGMGYFASARGDYDTNPDADFSMPPDGAPTGTIRGVVRDDSDKPVPGALVGLGGHDGPPAAGPALQAVSGPDGSYTITGIPQAAYPQLTVEAPFGYADALAGAVTVAGAPVTKDLTVRRNYAQGKTVISDARDETAVGCGNGRLVDGDQATVLETASPDDPDTPDTIEISPRTFQIDLGQQVPGAEVWIDPSNGCNGLGDNSLGSYSVEVSQDGTTFTEVAYGMFDRTNNSRLNRVPLKNVPPTVRYVRLIAYSTQAAHVASFFGDQGYLQIAELQVYGRPSGTTPGNPPGGGGGTPVPGAAKLRPVLTATKHKLTVNRKTRRTTVKLKCVRASEGTLPKRCRGRLTILGGKKGRKALGTRTFSIPTNRTLSVRIKITKRAVKLLRKHAIETRLRARVLNPGAKARTASYPVRVLRIKRR